MTAFTDATKVYTVAEYLDLEARSGERFEFYNGELKRTAGGTIPHNRIARNILAALHTAFVDQPDYEVFGSDQKVYLPHYNFYVYPDAIVVAGVPVLAETEADAITNPILIVEVLSHSTEKNDRGQKFLEYRSLPSFKEYVLVRQEAPEIVTFFRQQPDTWKETELNGLANSVHFHSINVALAFSVIYKNVEFNLPA